MPDCGVIVPELAANKSKQGRAVKRKLASVMLISMRRSRDGVEKSSHAPIVSKIDAPSGIEASPLPLFWNLRPCSTDLTRVFACSLSEMIASFIARNGSSGAGDITSSILS